MSAPVMSAINGENKSNNLRGDGGEREKEKKRMSLCTRYSKLPPRGVSRVLRGNKTLKGKDGSSEYSLFTLQQTPR